jgi:hypothetical protein
VHLASALAIGDPDLTLAVWDRRLHAGAATAGLPVAPAHLPEPRHSPAPLPAAATADCCRMQMSVTERTFVIKAAGCQPRDGR